MDPDAAERRLAAILIADVAGYSRLMADDEDATVRTVTAYREQIELHVRQAGGRMDFTGDNFLAEFRSPTEAVRCAVEIQRVLHALNANVSSERKMHFRMGVHMGEIRVEEERLFGTGINIAARLEGLADPGGLCISSNVYDEVRSKLDLVFEDRGEHEVKNIPKPVRVYRVRLDESSAESHKFAGQRRTRLKVAAASAAAIVAVSAVGLWLIRPAPLSQVLGQIGSRGPSVNTSPSDRPSIVVLPFANMSDDPDQEHFSDGITEDLITVLSSSPSLFVISRSSAFTYKGSEVRIVDVGRELGVRYVVEGSVRRNKDRLRITAQLIDAVTGYHIWSGRYDRDGDDIFDVQAELAEKIFEELGAEIREFELSNRYSRRYNDEIRDLLLRASDHYQRFTRADAAEAERLYNRVLELDPLSADAHAMIGALFQMQYQQLWNRDPAILDRAEAKARRALEIDPDSVPGHIALGMTYNLRGLYDEALAETEIAAKLVPGHHLPFFIRGFALMGKGAFVPALDSLRKSFRINLRSNSQEPILLGGLLLRTGYTEEGVEILERARAETSDVILVRIELAAHYVAEARLDEARELVREIKAVNPNLAAENAAAWMPGFDENDTTEFARRLRLAGMP